MVGNQVLKPPGTTGVIKVNVHLICYSEWIVGQRATAGARLIMVLIGSFTDRPVRAQRVLPFLGLTLAHSEHKHSGKRNTHSGAYREAIGRKDRTNQYIHTQSTFMPTCKDLKHLQGPV